MGYFVEKIICGKDTTDYSEKNVQCLMCRGQLDNPCEPHHLMHLCRRLKVDLGATTRVNVDRVSF